MEMNNLLIFSVNNQIKDMEVEPIMEVKKDVIQKGIDVEVSNKQQKSFMNAIEYMEDIVRNDGKIKDLDYINKIELKNYSIIFSKDGKYIHILDINNGFKYGVVSLGNKKLISSEYRIFIIFNILQRISCPNATVNCLKFCYANKSNNNVKCNTSSRNSRLINTVLSMVSNFDIIINEVIELVISSTKKEIIFRFHESGDIYSPIYWNKIKNILKYNKDIKFMFYTKSIFLLDEINEINELDNVLLRYSVDSSTITTIASKCLRDNIHVFVATDNIQVEDTIEQIVNKFICNSLKVNHKDTLDKIESLRIDMYREKRITYRKNIIKEMNKLRKSMINNKQECTNCMKCFNKKNKSLFVLIH